MLFPIKCYCDTCKTREQNLYWSFLIDHALNWTNQVLLFIKFFNILFCILVVECISYILLLWSCEQYFFCAYFTYELFPQIWIMFWWKWKKNKRLISSLAQLESNMQRFFLLLLYCFLWQRAKISSQLHVFSWSHYESAY